MRFQWPGDVSVKSTATGTTFTSRSLDDMGITPSIGKYKTAANGWICHRASVVHCCVVCEVLPFRQRRDAMSAQSLEDAHRDRVCMCTFIG